jgi:hypothetical protein
LLCRSTRSVQQPVSMVDAHKLGPAAYVSQLGGAWTTFLPRSNDPSCRSVKSLKKPLFLEVFPNGAES